MYLKCKSKTKIYDAESASKVFREILQNENEIDQQKEHLWAMGLNTQNRVLYLELVGLGILNEHIVHPREVFRSAIFSVTITQAESLIQAPKISK